jgi:hypothetical protein
MLLGLLLFLVFTVSGCAFKDTPRHSLSELRAALLNRDADAAMRYIDVDSVVECMVSDIFLKHEGKAGSPLEKLGIAAGKGAANIIMPAAKALVRMQVKAAISSHEDSGYFQQIRRASVWYLNITRDGDTAIVEPKGKSNTKFRMTRAPEGHWRIVEIIRTD